MNVIIIILIIILLITTFCSRKQIDNFNSFNCMAVQNQFYSPEEIDFKSKCRNLVILEKERGFFAEEGDESGPFFSKDYIRYYHEEFRMMV